MEFEDTSPNHEKRVDPGRGRFWEPQFKGGYSLGYYTGRSSSLDKKETW